MPRLTRWFIKTSLVDLVLALALAITMALTPLLRGPSLAWIFPVYVHILAFGWLSQLIFGVAYWMFPKYSLEKPHANETVGWAVYFSINAGLLLRAVCEPINSLDPHGVWGVGLVVSAALQWLAGLAFVLNTWGRIKEK